MIINSINPTVTPQIQTDQEIIKNEMPGVQATQRIASTSLCAESKPASSTQKPLLMKLLPSIAGCAVGLACIALANDIDFPWAASVGGGGICMLGLVSIVKNGVEAILSLTTPLAIAVRSNDIKTVAKLLNQGADPNGTGKNGLTPLHSAVLKDNVAIVEFLLKNEANPNVENTDGFTPLTYAVITGNLAIAELLLKNGANPNTKIKDGLTPLHDAVLNDNVAITDLLLKNGANPNTKYKDAYTPLHLAVTSDKPNLEVVELLLSYGADVNRISGNTSPPFGLMQNPVFENTKVYQMAKEADNGTTQEYFDLTMLAHYYGLSGATVIDGQIISLEGVSTENIAEICQNARSDYYTPMIEELRTGQHSQWSKVIQSLSPETLTTISSLEGEKIANILTNTLSAIATTPVDEALERHTQGLPVGRMTGWDRHGTGLALFGNSLARCNKGDRCGTTPGILIDTIGNQKGLKNSLQQLLPKSTVSYFTKKVVKDLKLSNRIHLLQKEQKVGNCGVANQNSLELALLYLQLEPLVGRKAAEELARALKKARKEFSKIELLKKYLQRHQQPNQFSPDLGLLGQIYEKQAPDSMARNLIDAWATKKEIPLSAMKTLGSVQAFICAYLSPSDPRPSLNLLARAYRTFTGVPEIDQHIKKTIELSAEQRGIAKEAIATLNDISVRQCPPNYVSKPASKTTPAWSRGFHITRAATSAMAIFALSSLSSFDSPYLIPIKLIGIVGLPLTYMEGVLAAIDGSTPLHRACAVGEKTAALFIKLGFDVNARNFVGKTPMHFARSRKVIDLLLKHGAAMEAKDTSNKTPLYTASEANKVDLADHLVALGADTSMTGLVNGRQKARQLVTFLDRIYT